MASPELPGIQRPARSVDLVSVVQVVGLPAGDRRRPRPSGTETGTETGTGTGNYQPRTHAKMRGATIVASDSMTNFGVSTSSLPQVIFSLGTAPEYPP